jgi:predicted ATPase
VLCTAKGEREQPMTEATTMNHDRITRLYVSGVRVVGDVALDLKGLTVLIGDNGTGKSTLLEAVELLRQAASPKVFVEDVLVRRHGGLRSLLRRDAKQLRLEVVVSGAGPQLEYRLAIGFVGTAAQIAHEYLDVRANPADRLPVNVLARRGVKATITDAQGNKLPEVNVPEGALALTAFGLTAPPALQRLTSALDRIEHHVPFATRPLWQQHELGLRVGPRWPEFLVERQRHMLSRYALNLSSCYQQLRNLSDEVWSRVVERARLGLGDDLRGFSLLPSGQGSIELQIVFGSLQSPIPVDGLSEGQLAYLAFIALVELNQERSLLVFDEPELHLHPALLSRVVGMLEEVAETCPVLITTHSDRLLDALANPAETVVLCELNERGATQLRKPNAERLTEWLKSYRGIGNLRSEGYEANVFDGGQIVSGTEDRQ